MYLIHGNSWFSLIWQTNSWFWQKALITDRPRAHYPYHNVGFVLQDGQFQLIAQDPEWRHGGWRCGAASGADARPAAESLSSARGAAAAPAPSIPPPKASHRCVKQSEINNINKKSVCNNKLSLSTEILK